MQNDNFLLPNNQQTLNILQLKFSCTFCDLPMCIIQYIVDNFLDEMDVIALSQINKKCHRIKIKNLYHISESLMKNLTCDILKQYPHVEQLNISRSVKNSKGSSFEGIFENSKLNGMATCIYYYGNIYRGIMQKGIITKIGEYIFSNKSIYKGEFKNDMFHGKGIFNGIDNCTYDGYLKNNKMHGEGKLTFANGLIYNGVFNENKFGDIKFIFKNGLIYEDIKVKIPKIKINKKYEHFKKIEPKIKENNISEYEQFVHWRELKNTNLNDVQRIHICACENSNGDNLNNDNDENNEIDEDYEYFHSNDEYDDIKKSILNDNINKCCICMENPREYVYNKCGHVCVCEPCANKINSYDNKGKMKKSICPICRTKGYIIKIFYDNI